MEQDPNLDERSDLLAVVAVVAAEALTHTGAVVTETTAGAVATFICALSSNRIIVARALNEAAVRTTVTRVAFATKVQQRIPCIIVTNLLLHSISIINIARELELRLA
jgi:hypothetical protein